MARALFLVLMGALTGFPAGPKDKPPVQYQIRIPAPPDLSPLNWLIGEWAGKTLPNSPLGEVKLSVRPVLEEHFLLLRGEISLSATPTVPATHESWLGIVSSSSAGTGYILQKFSNTGFMTRYQATVDEPEIVLNPQGGDSPPPGWLFRITWARSGPQEFTETVQAAPPGKAFFDYYTAQYTRVPPASKPTPAP